MLSELELNETNILFQKYLNCSISQTKANNFCFGDSHVKEVTLDINLFLYLL